MLSIAVCDDEILACSQTAGKIKTILEEWNVPCEIRQFVSGKELLQAPEQFDIVFLDILMPEPDGMKTAKLLREKTAEGILIFFSSSREYVFDAYEAEPFWYLVKPMEDWRLRKVLKRAVGKVRRQPREFLVVISERQKKKLFLADVCYFEIRGRMIYAHQSKEIFHFYEQIGALERQLQGKGFFRCHKSYLVNLGRVRSYNRREITMDQGEKILIAKRRYEDFCQELLEYMKENGGIL